MKSIQTKMHMYVGHEENITKSEVVTAYWLSTLSPCEAVSYLGGGCRTII